MKPYEVLSEIRAPDGTAMKLVRRGDEYIILAGEKSLMSSRMHGSEEELATLACQRARQLERPRVLVGGLGMGFTLRATLDALPPGARVVVAEIIPAVVEWNRGPVGPLAREPLADRRVQVETRDVAEALRSAQGDGAGSGFDAVLLDVDNGPSAFTTSGNDWLYGDRGLAAAHAALAKDGVLAVWSAREDRKFEQRLRYAGFTVEARRVRGRSKSGGPWHTIFLAHKKAHQQGKKPGAKSW